MGRPDVTLEWITHIAKRIGLDSFISKSLEGYDTPLLPDGRNVPRNVRTKILLARSLAGQPQLLLYEDFMAHLEAVDRMQIISYLTSAEQPATMLAVSDDPIVAQEADRVIVMENGKVMADAPWSELPKEMKLIFLPDYPKN